MDDATKTMLQTLAIGAVQKGLMLGGAGLAAHGFGATSGTSAEMYAGIATALVAAGISFWRDYGRAIVTSQLELLKARSLAAAAKLQANGVPSVTPAEIAAQSPTLTPAQVVKVAATLAPAVKASVVPESHT